MPANALTSRELVWRVEGIHDFQSDKFSKKACSAASSGTQSKCLATTQINETSELLTDQAFISSLSSMVSME